MKTNFIQKAVLSVSLLAVFSFTSCKDNDVREGEMVSPEGIEAEQEGTAATDRAADTTSKAEEDSLIEAPSP